MYYIQNKKMKLTVQKQRELLNIHRPLLLSHINQMSGTGLVGMGLGDIINNIKKFLEPVMPFIKDIAPKVLEKYVLPFIKKKMEGGGLSPAGSGLKLAGQGKKKLPHQIKGSQAAKDHMAKLRAMKKK